MQLPWLRSAFLSYEKTRGRLGAATVNDLAGITMVISLALMTLLAEIGLCALLLVLFSEFQEFPDRPLLPGGGPLRWTAVSHPFSEQINAGLRPWAFAPWRRRRHDGATNPTNAVINSSGVSFDFIIARQVKPFYHPLNVPLSKKRANISLKACGHRPSLRD